MRKLIVSYLLVFLIPDNIVWDFFIFYSFQLFISIISRIKNRNIIWII